MLKACQPIFLNGSNIIQSFACKIRQKTVPGDLLLYQKLPRTDDFHSVRRPKRRQVLLDFSLNILLHVSLNNEFAKKTDLQSTHRVDRA